MGLVKPLKSRAPSNKTFFKITFFYFMQSWKEYIALEKYTFLYNSKNDKDSLWPLRTYEANEIIYRKNLKAIPN